MTRAHEDLLVAAPVLAPLLAVCVAALGTSRPATARLVALGVSALNLAGALALLARVADAGSLSLGFGGWLASVRADGPALGDLAPSLLADPASATLVATFALAVAALTLHSHARPETPDEQARTALALPLVALGGQTACLAADLATQVFSLELMTLGAALTARPDAREASGGLLRTSLVATTIALLGLTALVAFTGTTRLAALPEALGRLPPQTRDVAQAALLAVVASLLHRAAVTPLGGWLLALTRDSASRAASLAPLLAVAGFAALSRLHHPLTAGLEAAVAAGCGPCRDLRLEHLDALLLPLGVAGAVLTSLGALRSDSLARLGGWLIAGGLATALVALTLPGGPRPGPAPTAMVQLAQVALAGVVLMLIVEFRAPASGPSPSQPAVMAPFAVATAALVGLPPLAGFTVQLVAWRALRESDAGLVAIGALALAMGLATLAVARAASRHLWRAPAPEASTSQPAPWPSRLAVATLTLAILALTVGASPLLAHLASGGRP